MIPLFNPQYEFEMCRETILNAFRRVAESGIYVNGAECERFESMLAASCEASHAVGVASGTMALELLLRADNAGHGTRVVTTAHTFVAVLEAILAVNAEPLFVDIDPETWQMPAGHWPHESVIVCHLYGGVSEAVKSSARLLYEDASQSFGGSLDGHPLGTLARAGAVSLYPTKNLSAIGDAGVIMTNDAELASRLRALRNHGQSTPQVHDYCGTTGRLDEVQAAILSEKLKHFNRFLEARRQASRFYHEHLSDLPLRFPKEIHGSVAAPNLFVLRTEARDELQEHLKAQGIKTGIHYPTPLHRMPAYRDRSWSQVSLPHTERLCAETLSLPLWAGITPEQQRQVVDAVRAFFR
jgi:dTDP-4-amino-4,6-dideoxygalactose transaminase